MRDFQYAAGVGLIWSGVILVVQPGFVESVVSGFLVGIGVALFVSWLRMTQ